MWPGCFAEHQALKCRAWCIHSATEVSVVYAEKTLLDDCIDMQPSERKSFFKL